VHSNSIITQQKLFLAKWLEQIRLNSGLEQITERALKLMNPSYVLCDYANVDILSINREIHKVFPSYRKRTFEFIKTFLYESINFMNT